MYVTRSVYALGVIAIIAILVGGCSNLGTKEDKTKDWSVQRLYDTAKASLNGGDYETAIDYYQKLEARYPFGRFAQQSQLEIAYAYYKYEEPASALAAVDRFIKLYPGHPSLDYAYYLKGLINFNRGKGFVTAIIERYVPSDDSQRDTSSLRDAFQDFAELTRRFPDSTYANDATQRMLYLRNTLAQHEIHVANYYMDRKAFLAAANRAKFVVENYQRAPSVAEALVIMAKAYKLLELDGLARDALRVLELNFPDHPGINEVANLAVRS